jgi:hypothetical protein
MSSRNWTASQPKPPDGPAPRKWGVRSPSAADMRQGGGCIGWAGSGTKRTHSLRITSCLNQGRPVRGRSHPIITSCGVRRLRDRLCRWTAALAKASACSPDCRFWRSSVIHSRMTARRTFGLAIWIPFRGADGPLPDRRISALCSYSDHFTARYAAFWTG